MQDFPAFQPDALQTIIIALATLAGLSASLPAQAATRSVGITIDRFADRCIAQGGTLSDANPSFSCETPNTVIECSFLDLNNAECQWPGIENQIAVNRVIGMPDAQSLNEGTGGVAPGQGGGGKGGGFKNDLPIKWK
jgi:hypothetical protein